MRVRCKFTDLPSIGIPAVVERLSPTINIEEGFADIEVNGEYEVVAIELRDHGLWYLLALPDLPDFPYPFPSELFDVSDPALPSDWEVRIAPGGSGNELQLMSFREWVRTLNFYERLLSGEAGIQRIYERILRKSSASALHGARNGAPRLVDFPPGRDGS